MESGEAESLEDGPKYRYSSFLFGNVNRQGQIEDYQNDDDLKAINNIDQCHVKEVEEAARAVISNERESSEEPTNFEFHVIEPPAPADYYDEEEAVADTALEISMHNLAPEVEFHKTALDGDEDYDSPGAETMMPGSSHLVLSPPTKAKAPLIEVSASSLGDTPSTCDSISTRVGASPTNKENSFTGQPSSLPGKEEQLRLDGIPEASPTSSSEEQDSQTTPTKDMMPPPLHPAPVAASRQAQIKLSVQKNAESLLVNSSTLLSDTSTIPEDNSASGDSNFNTPLGGLMPPEYASTEITELFPAYDSSRPPRWSSLFRLPHSLQIYREFIERAPLVADLLAQRPSNTYGRLHLVYDNYLDLGEIPLPEEIVERDEVEELNTPGSPDLDYLAGSENSWWRRAFSAALNKATKLSMNEEKQLPSDGITRRETDNTRCTVYPPNLNKKNNETGKNPMKFEERSVSSADLVLGWRLGPAKYWYDQLGLPLDIDITTWRDWRRQTPYTCGTTVSDVHSTTTQDVGSGYTVKSEEVPADTAGETQRPNESATDQSDELSASRNGDWLTQTSRSNNVVSSINAKPSDMTPFLRRRSSVLSRQTQCEPPQNAFYPYQLINWEDDIIYDPQLSANKISASSKTNAAFAGWIPSQHCRTMAAFQDAYQGKFPFIVGSKALNGLSSGNSVMENLFKAFANSKPPSAPPYAIFPVENQGILSDSWVYDIIYDSDLPVEERPPPFLLTLDHNDESCILDTVGDTDIANAISAARSQRQKFASTRGGNTSLDQSTSVVDNSGGHEAGQWSPNGSHLSLDPEPAIASSKPSVSMNRTSLQVSFGLASTRGMLTGALAKAEHGAEKVKMILGKHGLLAEDDWQADQDRFGSDLANGNSINDSTDLRADGNAFATAAAAVSGIPPKDPLNLSNDEYYALRSGALGICGLARCGPLQHSIPAVELWPPFFPTYASPLRLRQFHRVQLKRYLRGPMAQYNIPFPVTNLLRHIQRKAREREEEKAATGGGEIFFMRTPADLSGADGDLVLFEFSEEFPPLMTQVGMASRVINYYRPLNPRDRSLSPAPHATSEPPDLPYGSLVYVSGTDSPFLGVIRPGGCLQTLENNMYRAPVYPHEMPGTDFLLIRNRNGISIRRINMIFTVGQEIPLMEVPGPNSKRANNFVRDFLQVFILRLFLRSTDEPKRIKIEEIRKAFPNHSESSVRKRLKICADFKRTGSDASWWVLRSHYRLPSEEEVRYLVSPEDCCAHYSMLAAELRLKDAGYGEKYLFVLDENQEDEEEKEGQPKMEDEVRAAPWNTTRAYLASQRGGCFLELHGAADPTGCGEAFSYSKTSAKPGALFRQAGGEVARGLLKGRRTVTGTDADLRKLHLRDARALLRTFGISEADLKSFKRWEIIDMVRFTSTERAKQGEEEGSAKFARGNRLSMGEQIRCYREECQRIFDLQNRVLSNPELLSSDEEVSSEEEDEEVTGGGDGVGGISRNQSSAGGSGSNANTIGGVRLSSLSSSARSFSHLGRNMDSLVSEHRREEQDKEKLKRALESGEPLLGGKRPRKNNPGSSLLKELGTSNKPVSANSGEKGSNINSAAANAVYEASASAAGTILDLPPPWPSASRKCLRIIRTYSEDGHQYTRTELVPWSPVVEIYLKIRQTRDDEFIHNFVDSDDQFKEQQRREKRRIQDQLRRLRKQQALMRERGTVGGGAGNSSLRPGVLVNDPNRRRRHKPLTSALIKMRCGACGQTGHMRTNKECPMYGKSVLPASESAGRRLDRNRLRSSASLRGLERSGDGSKLLSSARDLDKLGGSNIPDAVAAAQALASRPVSELLAEQEQEESIDKACFSGKFSDADTSDTKHHGPGEEDGGQDLPQGVFEDNDVTVEGTKLKLHSGLTRYIHEQNRRNLKLKIRRQLLDRLNAAAAVVQSAASGRRGLTNKSGIGRGRRTSVGATEDDFISGFKHRGNRRRIDPRVALNHIFEGIYKSLAQIPGHKIFLHPVKEKDFPNYYSQITEPMDLSQIRMKINDNAYATREEFLTDIRLIYKNSLKFNGRYSSYTETAMKMCSHVMEEFCHKELKLMRLESLVNPLLDEDDLVGLSYLLQQSIDAMRRVEHSRPFHIPVDKRRYPDYYKVISNPMDLSTLEKMVKENRFHSREEFFVQVNLILNNCITFNGEESSLTEIAHKMVAAGRARLDQDEEVFETIESNIRSHMGTTGSAGSSSQADIQVSHSVPDINDMEAPSTSKPTSSEPKSDWPPVSSAQSKSIKRLLDDSSSGSRRGAKTPRLNLNPSERASVTESINVNAETNPGQKRVLRRRPNDAWYGVDLEYDDMEEEEGEETSCCAKSVSNPPVDGNVEIKKPWMTDEESMDTSISRFDRSRAASEHLKSSNLPDMGTHGQHEADSYPNRRSPFDSSHQTLKGKMESLQWNGIDVENSHDGVRRGDNSQTSLSGKLASDHGDDYTDDELGHQREKESQSVGSYSSGSDAAHDWNRIPEQLERNVTYFDEDTRFSMTDLPQQSYSQAEFTDDLVAQDLQLTDSDEDSCLSDQGGELCRDNSDPDEMISSEPRHDPQTDSDDHFQSGSPLFNLSKGEPVSRDSNVNPQQSQVHTVNQSDHVAFFISESEEDSERD